MRYGLIGEKLGHSFSKEIHGLLGDYEYCPKELKPEELEEFLKKREFAGINVTIPYKEAVIPYLDEVEPAARAIGAVNTVVCKNGRLVGSNTDFYGMKSLLEREKISLEGRRVYILGTGGTSKTAFAVAKDGGARKICKVSRTPHGEGEISYEELYARREAPEILLNTTPVGMFPKEEGMAADPEQFPNLAGVLDVIYHPLRTDFVCKAQKIGVPAAGGLYMLVAQAAKAAELFFEDPSFLEKTERVYRTVLERKENLVLVGMPACGKTTVGRLLSEATGREFADSDRSFEERQGRPIADYFRTEGESAFRREESRILKELSDSGGRIIATGGGAILREENRRCLKRNGLLIYLERPLEELLCTSDRPLSKSPEALEKMYRERKPLYEGAADLRIPVGETPEQTVKRILKALEEREQ